jgi:polysaccharide pyruvyl transferase WcaK-like protein
MSADPTQPRIALFGAFGAGNLGNECTLQALLHNLSRYAPNAQISCICTGPDETAASHNIRGHAIREAPLAGVHSRPFRLLRRIFVGIPVELYRWFKAIRTLKGSHMLIMTGTGMLSDLGIGPLGLHYDILRWSIAAKLCRCKLLFVSVGVGPIRHPLSRFFVKAALGLAEYRSYRDIFSKNYLESIGFAAKVDAVYPDLAFSLPRAVVPARCRRNGQGAVIGVGLITSSGKPATSEKDETIYDDYITKVASFVGWLLERNYTVRLLIGDVVYDNRVRQDLRALLERGGLNYDGRKIIDEPACSVADLLLQLAGTDLVVASRFHNVLLALMLSKPVVAISFHEKVDSLMSALGLSAFCQDIEHVDVGKLIAQFTALEENTESLKLQIERKIEAYRRVLDKQYEDIFKEPRVHELVASRT